MDVRDVAEAGLRALAADGVPGVLPVCGPEPLTGEDVAAAWSRHLGRTVRYAGDDLDAWEARVRSVMPDWIVHALRLMYAYVQARGIPPEPGDAEALERVLGHPPRRYEDWVRESAAARAA